MYVDNNWLATTNFDPNTAWSKPWDPEFYGETHDLSDYMPGSGQNHTLTAFTYLQYGLSYSCPAPCVNPTTNYQDLTRSDMAGGWTGNTNNNNYQQGFYDNTHSWFNIWDQRQ